MNAGEQKEVKLSDLKSQRDELQKEVERLEKAKETELQNYKVIKEQKRAVKYKYEATVWERVDTEREIKKLGENLKMIESKIEEAKKASTVTDGLVETLEKLKARILIFLERRTKLQEQRGRLESEISRTKQTLALGYSESADKLRKKRDEADMLFQQFNSRRNIGDVVLKLYGDVAHIKHKTNTESIQRSNLNSMAQIQFQQIRHRIQISSEDREAISRHLDDCVALSSNICEGFEDVTKKTSDLLVQIEGGVITNVQNSAVNIISSIEDHLQAVEKINTRNEGDVDISQPEKLVEIERKALCKLDERQFRVGEQLRELDLKISKLRQMRMQHESLKKRTNSEVAGVAKDISMQNRKPVKSVQL